MLTKNVIIGNYIYIYHSQWTLEHVEIEVIPLRYKRFIYAKVSLDASQMTSTPRGNPSSNHICFDGWTHLSIFKPISLPQKKTDMYHVV